MYIYIYILIYSNPRIVLNTRLHLHTNIVIYILSVHSESILNDPSPYKPSFGFFGSTIFYEHRFISFVLFLFVD